MVGQAGFDEDRGLVPATQNQTTTRSRLPLLGFVRDGAHVRGARQRVVAWLGKRDEEETAGLRSGWGDLPALLPGETGPERKTTSPMPGVATNEPGAARWEQVDVRGVRVERTRGCGEGYLRRALRHRLKLGQLLTGRLPAARDAVGWSQVAA